MRLIKKPIGKSLLLLRCLELLGQAVFTPIWIDAGRLSGLCGNVQDERRMRRWEEAGLLETTRNVADRRRFVRLTEAGRLAVLGGRDPEVEWGRPWYGCWNLIIFDLPVDEAALRKRINRSLNACRCGRIQGSVWVVPSVPDAARKAFREHARDLSHLMIMKTVPAGLDFDRKLAEGAWDFERINELYGVQIALLRERPGRVASKEALQRWIRAENEAWRKAVSVDPLLPKPVHPPDYLGMRSLRLRRRVQKEVGSVL